MRARPPVISVIGAGSWGTALAMTLAHTQDRVKLWGRDTSEMEEMARQRCNHRYLPDIPFPPNLTIETNFDQLIDDDLCFVIAVPSYAFHDTLESLHHSIIATKRETKLATIICGAKGFAPNGKLLSEITEQVFAERGIHAVISGPSFATETAQRLPTALTVACTDSSQAESIAAWFHTPTTRVYFSSDVVGVQLGGAIKNVLAIAAGISDGLGFGANARAALITRGLAELTRLGVALGGQPDTFTGLTGVGDLILTCTDDQSRNRRFGLGIGQGKSIPQIRDEIGQAIEGINAAQELHKISRTVDVEMPITEQVYRIVHKQHDPQRAVQDLLQRDAKSE